MEEQALPGVQRRRLGVTLRQARVAAGLTQREVAAELGWSLSKLIRLETAKVRISRTDLKALLSCYGITDRETVDELVRLAEEGRSLRWSAFRDVLGSEFLHYLEYESVATDLVSFQPMFVHGLLQTQEYADAIIKALAPSGTPTQTLAKQKQARLLRQEGKLVQRKGKLHFIFDEAVLRRVAGQGGEGAEVMRRQLERLIEVGRRPNVKIQVIPFNYGFHRGMLGPFTLLRFPDKADGELLFIESGDDGLVARQNPRLIQRYRLIARELAKAGSDPGDLEKVIAGIEAALS